MSALHRTYRQRREARAERLREWAAKREAKAAERFARADQISERFYGGQPIIVGHHSEAGARRDQARIWDAMEKGIEHQDKAAEMAGKAANIEAAAERAIYSDDPDAVEALRARLAGLEAEREHCKVVNAAIRAYEKREHKTNQDLTAADLAACGVTPDDVRHMAPDWHGWRVPSYHLSNLGGQISKTRERLAKLTGDPIPGRCPIHGNRPTFCAWAHAEDMATP